MAKAGRQARLTDKFVKFSTSIVWFPTSRSNHPPAVLRLGVLIPFLVIDFFSMSTTTTSVLTRPDRLKVRAAIPSPALSIVHAEFPAPVAVIVTVGHEG